MGEKAKRPLVCQGIRQLLTPCSIALTIWDVTRAYTSCFSVAVFSVPDIVLDLSTRCLGAVPGSSLTRSRFGLVFDSFEESNTRARLRIHPTPYGVKNNLDYLCIVASPPYPVLCTIEGMSVKIPPEVRAAMTEIARKFGRLGGKKAAQNSTPEERSARAKIASLAAAKKRTAERLARLAKTSKTKAAVKKRS